MVAAQLIAYALPLGTRTRAYVDHRWNLPVILDESLTAMVAETGVVSQDEPYR